MNGAITSTTADREEILTASDGVKEVNNIYILFNLNQEWVMGLVFLLAKPFLGFCVLIFFPNWRISLVRVEVELVVALNIYLHVNYSLVYLC